MNKKDQKFLMYGIPLLICLVIMIIALISFLVQGGSVSDDKIYMSGRDTSKYNTIDKVTHRVFFDITIDKTQMTTGRITIGLFGDTVPRTVKNFIEIAKGHTREDGAYLSYKHTTFNYIQTGVETIGGDVDGNGGSSIFGGTFKDENFKLKHTVPYLLSMTSFGRDSNGSKFRIGFSARP